MGSHRATDWSKKNSSSFETDVCVVGAGIAGLTTAYLLAKEGREVTVIDDGLIGGGETCRTAAHLRSAIDDRIYRIEKWHGAQKAKLAALTWAASSGLIRLKKLGTVRVMVRGSQPTVSL